MIPINPEAIGDPNSNPVVYVGEEVGEVLGIRQRTVLIVDRYFSKCSACNGNADPSERQHIHGGPGSGYRPGSGLGDTNGCGAIFTERYYVHDGRTEAIDPAAALPTQEDNR